MGVPANFPDELLRPVGRDHHGPIDEAKHHRPAAIGRVSPETPQRTAPIPAAEGKEAAIAADAQAPAEGQILDLRRHQAGQRQAGRPEEPLDEQVIAVHGIASDGEERAHQDDRDETKPDPATNGRARKTVQAGGEINGSDRETEKSARDGSDP